MKKKKFVPTGEQSDDFVIFDLSTTLQEYKLAFHLNKMPGYHLEREADLKVNHSSSKKPETFSFYFCEQEKERNMFLIHSLTDLNLLMKSYFLIFQGYFAKKELDKTIADIENIKEVLNINKIELSATFPKTSSQLKKKLAQVNAILTDLEYHMIEVGRKRMEQKVQLKKRPGSSKKLYN